jgi:hypothetical protein
MQTIYAQIFSQNWLDTTGYYEELLYLDFLYENNQTVSIF